MFRSSRSIFLRRPRESGDPGRATCRWPWVPAFAGTTRKWIDLNGLRSNLAFASQLLWPTALRSALPRCHRPRPFAEMMPGQQGCSSGRRRRGTSPPSIASDELVSVGHRRPSGALLVRRERARPLDVLGYRVSQAPTPGEAIVSDDPIITFAASSNTT
jgi:hypothetical protein